jgi:hypothetical protein
MNILLVHILESFLGETRKHNEDTGQIAFDCPVCSGKGLIDGKGNLEINYNRICLNVGLALTLTTCMAL